MKRQWVGWVCKDIAKVLDRTKENWYEWNAPDDQNIIGHSITEAASAVVNSLVRTRKDLWPGKADCPSAAALVTVTIEIDDDDLKDQFYLVLYEGENEVDGHRKTIPVRRLPPINTHFAIEGHLYIVTKHFGIRAFAIDRGGLPRHSQLSEYQ